MVACSTIELRREALRQLEAEIKSRSTNAIAVLEHQKGLV
jgi:hypothetical protein